MSSVFVVCGGPSVANIDLNRLRGRDIVAVNRSVLHVPEPSYFITIDYGFLGRISQEERRRILAMSVTKFFVVNYSSGALVDIDGRPVDTRANKVYDLSKFDTIIRSRRNEGISTDWADFRNGANSGHCGLQLAVLLRYQTIYLLGMDMQISGSHTHYHSGYGFHKPSKMQRCLDGYMKSMEVAVDDLHEIGETRVVSCSEISRLNDLIDYVPFEDALLST